MGGVCFAVRNSSFVQELIVQLLLLDLLGTLTRLCSLKASTASFM